MGEKVTAIVLAGGRGTRMKSEIQKQYMTICGKPMLYYSLKAFEESPVEEVILVTSEGEQEYCRQNIVIPYGFLKVKTIVAGGKERYHSVYEGLKAAKGSNYVLIHDGARPCVTGTIISDAIRAAKDYGACVIGMPVKDTIKVADEEHFAAATPERSSLWMIQTPQAFSYDLIAGAYEKLFSSQAVEKAVTDDAMVVETMTAQKVKLIAGSYENIKVTTPEDILLAETLLNRQGRVGE